MWSLYGGTNPPTTKEKIMAAQIEFTATEADGTVHTRTSGTMPYVAFAGGTWHKSYAAAVKASTDRYHAAGTKVIAVVPTKIVGKLGDWTPQLDGWGDIPASAFTALVEAKLPAMAQKIESPVTGASILAGAVAAAKETPAQARARQRAAKKAREAAALVVEVAQAATVDAPILKKGQKLVDGKPVWKNSGEAHNAYRRARRAQLAAAKAAK